MFTDPKNLLTYHTADRKIRLNGTPVHIVPIRSPIEINSVIHGERTITHVVGAAPLPGCDTLLARVLHGETDYREALQLISRYRVCLDGDYSRSMLTYGFDANGDCHSLLYDIHDAEHRRSPWMVSAQDDDAVLGSLNHSLVTLCNDILVTAANAEAGLQALIKIATHRYHERGDQLAREIEKGLDDLESGRHNAGLFSVLCEAINDAWPVKSAIDNTIPRFMLATSFAKLHEKFNHVE